MTVRNFSYRDEATMATAYAKSIHVVSHHMAEAGEVDMLNKVLLSNLAVRCEVGNDSSGFANTQRAVRSQMS
jgi:hypothetical protein